jgi:hypothetical protein
MNNNTRHTVMCGGLFFLSILITAFVTVTYKAPHSPERRRDATQGTMIGVLGLVTKN